MRSRQTPATAQANDRRRECPWCCEEIDAEATRCPHCRWEVAPQPGHGGTCPACREAIHPLARLCKHCGADISSASASFDDELLGRTIAALAAMEGRGELRREGGVTTYAAAANCGACDGVAVVHWYPHVRAYMVRTCWYFLPYLSPYGALLWRRVEYTVRCSNDFDVYEVRD
jgi:Double zinc ribbon